MGTMKTIFVEVAGLIRAGQEGQAVKTLVDYGLEPELAKETVKGVKKDIQDWARETTRLHKHLKGLRDNVDSQLFNQR